MIKNIKFILQFAFFTLCLAAWTSTYADNVQKYINTAESHIANGDLKAAIIQLKNAIQLEPKNPQARFILGLTYIKIGNAASAEKELKRARSLGISRKKWIAPLGKSYLSQRKAREILDEIKITDNKNSNLNANIHALRATAQILRQQLDKANEEIQKGLSLASDNTEILLAAARLAIAQKNVKRASTYVQNVIKIQPNHIEALLFQAELDKQAGRFKRAIQSYDKVLKINPHQHAARLNKATVLIAIKDMPGVEKEIEILEKESPGLILVQYLKAVVTFNKKDFDKTRTLLQQVLAAAPNHLPSHLLIGTVYYTNNQLESAETHLAQYIAAVPQHSAARKLLGAVRLKRNNPQEAIQILEPLLIQFPKDAQLLALLGSAYMQKRDFSRGNEYLEKAAKLSPNVAQIRTQLALSNLAGGKSDQAVSQLEAAVDMDQNLVQADVMLILVHIQQKKFDKALSAAQVLEKKIPNNPMAHNLMSAAYLGKGDRKLARASLEKALQVDPKFYTAILNLARLDEQEKNLDGARQRYDAILKSEPGHLASLLAMARLSEQTGGGAEAALHYVEKARESNPDAIEPAALLIRYYIKQKQALKGLSIARDLADKHVKNPGVIQILGEAQLAADEKSSAISSFKRLVKRNEKSTNAYYHLARAYVANKDNWNARTNIEKALQLDEKHLLSLTMLSKIEQQEGHGKEARKAAKKIQSIYPKSPLGFLLEGSVDTGKGNYAKALKQYEKAYAISANSKIAHLIYGTRKKLRDNKGAVQVLEDWLTKSPDDDVIRMILASEYQQQGERKKSIRAYEELKSRQEQNAIVWNNLAWLYYETNDKRALGYAEKAYELSSKKPEIADTLGWISVKTGDVERGLKLLKQAAIFAPHIPDIRYHLAEALYVSGDISGARKELRRLLETYKDFPEKNKALELKDKIN